MMVTPKTEADLRANVAALMVDYDKARNRLRAAREAAKQARLEESCASAAVSDAKSALEKARETWWLDGAVNFK